ncbi:MAG: site-specific integrase [Sediminibacterium sp.]|nr:site-specific integrase [Sediminibacterium sp.]
MATLKFYLQRASKKNLFPIMMCYQDKGKKFRFFTKMATPNPNWQKNKFKPISLSDFEDRFKIDTCENVIREIEKEGILQKINFSVSDVENLFRQRIMETVPYKENVEESKEVDDKPSQSGFYDFFDQFVEQSKATKSYGTIQHYKTFKTTMLKYEKKTGNVVAFESINSSFYVSFQNYMINDAKFLNNTIGGQFKELKVFLNYAMRNGMTDIKYNFKDFRIIKEDIDIIALTWDELIRLYECKGLPAPQEIAKDYFCLECFTGLRFSDIARLRTENIKEDFIEIRTKKTKDILFVPINVFVREILDKYKNKYAGSPLPPAFANHTINEYIKEAAKRAGIIELTMVEKFSGSKCIVTTKPKYAFVSTHTGRRTFITLSHEKGMHIEMIMKITGIRKWDTLKKYLKVSEKAKLMKMNEFWNRSSFKIDSSVNQKTEGYVSYR